MGGISIQLPFPHSSSENSFSFANDWVSAYNGPLRGVGRGEEKWSFLREGSRGAGVATLGSEGEGVWGGSRLGDQVPEGPAEAQPPL